MASHDGEKIKKLLLDYLKQVTKTHPDVRTLQDAWTKSSTAISQSVPGGITPYPFAAYSHFEVGELWDKTIDNYMTNPALHTFATFNEALEFFKPIILNTIIKVGLLISLINMASANLVSKSPELREAYEENAQISVNDQTGDISISTINKDGERIIFTIMTTKISSGLRFSLDDATHLYILADKFGWGAKPMATDSEAPALIKKYMLFK